MAREFDIVFVNPPLTQEERYGVKYKAGGNTPPTGLAMLAAVCRRAGYKPAVIDTAALGLGFKETIDMVLRLHPKYVGLTAVTMAIDKAARVAQEIKARDPSITILVGGPHITFLAQETADRYGYFFDIAVIGEGEATIIELMDAFTHNKPLSNIAGIAYLPRGGKKLVFTKHREFIQDIDTLPFPAWGLMPNLAKYYSPPAHTVQRFPATLLFTSRGCPGQCTFCPSGLFGRVLRCHSADYVINMIKYVQKHYGIKEIQFRDDNFLVFRKRTIELCTKIIEQKIDIVWSCAGRIDMADVEVLKLMKKAGCWQIWYGIESGSDKVLLSVHKNTNQEKIRKAIWATKKAGISPCGFFVIGLPTEKEEDIKKTLKVQQSLPLDEFHMSHFTPLPGSELYLTASQYGHFENNWKKMNGWTILFVPKGLTKAKLVTYSNLAFRRFYLRPRIFLNYLKRLRSIHHLKVYATAFLGLMSFTSRKHRNAGSLTEPNINEAVSGQ